MRPHYSQSSRENATPSSGTSPLASYKEVPHPPPRARNYGGPLYTAFRTSSTVTIKRLLCLKMDAKFPNFKQLGKQYDLSIPEQAILQGLIHFLVEIEKYLN